MTRTIVSLTDLLGVLFIGLKLGGVIDWPWLWVLAPIWMPISLAILLLVIAGVISAIIKHA
jgi:hypothetical protein